MSTTIEETASITRLRAVEADVVLKPNRGLPRMPFLKLHALHCGLEEPPQHAGICNRGSGEGRGYQARCRTADSSQQEHGESLPRGEAGSGG